MVTWHVAEDFRELESQIQACLHDAHPEIEGQPSADKQSDADNRRCPQVQSSESFKAARFVRMTSAGVA